MSDPTKISEEVILTQKDKGDLRPKPPKPPIPLPGEKIQLND